MHGGVAQTLIWVHVKCLDKYFWMKSTYFSCISYLLQLQSLFGLISEAKLLCYAYEEITSRRSAEKLKQWLHFLKRD